MKSLQVGEQWSNINSRCKYNLLSVYLVNFEGVQNKLIRLAANIY